MVFTFKRMTLAVFASSLLAFAGCSSTPERPKGEAAGRPHVRLEGKATFFDGQIRATASLALQGRPGAGDRDGPPGEGGGRRMRRPPGGGGPGMPDGFDGDEPVRPLHRAGGPTLVLQVRFENTGREAVTFTVRDVNSALGNFAPRPDRLSLEPGQSAELDPMFSVLGAGAAQLPVTVVLRTGDRTETQVLLLERAPAPAPAATP